MCLHYPKCFQQWLEIQSLFKAAVCFIRSSVTTRTRSHLRVWWSFIHWGRKWTWLNGRRTDFNMWPRLWTFLSESDFHQQMVTLLHIVKIQATSLFWLRVSWRQKLHNLSKISQLATIYPLFHNCVQNLQDVIILNKATFIHVIAANVQRDCKESVLVYYKAESHSGSLHQGSTSQRLTKHLLVLCLFAMSSASFCITCVVEDMWQRRDWGREREREMKTKLTEDKEHLSVPVLFPLRIFC